jgi:hypothetical protein
LSDPSELRELDCVIAQEVFNSDVARVPAEWGPSNWTAGLPVPPAHDFPMMGSLVATPETVPHYSTDERCAASVVDRVKRDQEWIVQTDHRNAGWTATVSNVPVRGTVTRQGTTYAEVVCRAVLDAYGRLLS